jgi:arsenate reductase (thioredoxin)
MVMRNVLFVCVGNSGRSQMAEAYFNHLAPEGMRAASAGTQPASQVDPLAVAVMRQIGIGMDRQTPKLLTPEMVTAADRVISMGCGVAETCPALFVPAEDWQLDDPAGQPVEKLRQIRDAVIEKVDALIRRMQAAG